MVSLHPLFSVNETAVVCPICGRRWRFSFERMAEERNVLYLNDHLEGHREVKRKPPSSQSNVEPDREYLEDLRREYEDVG